METTREGRKAARRADILEAAFTEFCARGYAGTRLEDVAARVGVTKGTVHFHFGTKDQLFAEVIESVAAAPMAELAAAFPLWSDDLAADLALFLESAYAVIARNPRAGEALRLVIAEATRFPALADAYVERFVRPPLEHLRARLATAADEGAIAAREPWLAELIVSPILALRVMTLLLGPRLPIDTAAFRHAHIALLLEGLR